MPLTCSFHYLLHLLTKICIICIQVVTVLAAEEVTHPLSAEVAHKPVTGVSLAAIDVKEVTAEVASPSGSTLAAQLEAVGNDTFTVRFVPTEIGLHHISVKYRGVDVPGSPFPFTIGQMGEGGASKVKAGGSGLEGAQAGEPGTLATGDALSRAG